MAAAVDGGYVSSDSDVEIIKTTPGPAAEKEVRRLHQVLPEWTRQQIIILRNNKGSDEAYNYVHEQATKMNIDINDMNDDMREAIVSHLQNK